MVPASPAPTVEFDAELLSRYDVTGPRYTSYPTAPSFREDFGEADYRAAALGTNEDPIPRPLSLYVHVPFCESPCFYCGCTRVITRDHGNAARYLDHLEREIALQGALFDSDRAAVQLHLGGGTPNFLTNDELGRLVRALASAFRLDAGADRDFSIELDPRQVQPGDLAALAALGFNRVSLGVQDFDPDVQRAINRLQPASQTEETVAAAREAGMRSVNLDLIYGLPRQDPASFGETLERVVALRPERVALYAYAHLPERFKAQRQIAARDLPAPGTKLMLLGTAIRALTDAGYRYIGMDHFALPEDPLAKALDAGTLQRNFQGYSTHGQCDLVGLGVSAISHVDDCYAQNERVLPDYYEAIEKGRLPVARGLALSEDDMLRAEIIQSVMCRNALDFDAIERRFSIDFEGRFARELALVDGLAADGLVTRAPRGFTVTPRGRLLLRVVAMAFDASFLKKGDRPHLPEDNGPKGPRPLYSRVI
jgi:oxygen-independent coproporphyrinogen-3 oxidase